MVDYTQSLKVSQLRIEVDESAGMEQGGLAVARPVLQARLSVDDRRPGPWNESDGQRLCLIQTILFVERDFYLAISCFQDSEVAASPANPGERGAGRGGFKEISIM